jgi:hypothetical protein
VETGQGVQGAATGDPTPVRSVAACVASSSLRVRRTTRQQDRHAASLNAPMVAADSARGVHRRRLSPAALSALLDRSP